MQFALHSLCEAMAILPTEALDSAVSQLRCNPQIVHAAEQEKSQVEDLVLRSQD